MYSTCKTKTACAAKLKEKIWRNIPAQSGIVLGAIGGYFYYRLAGCSTGTCPITSNPWTSILLGAVTGNLIAGIFTIRTSKKNEKEHGID